MARRASDPIPITRPAVLAVEGDDEFYLLVELCRQEGLRERIHLYNLDGRDGLAEKLEALAEADGFANVKGLGVMLDAEGTPAEDVAERVQQVCASVFDPLAADNASSGCPLPCPGQIRTFVAEECIEDICLRPALVQSDGAMGCVDAYLECIAPLVQDATVGQASKRRAYAYLASREEPGLRIGQAAYAGHWHFEDPCWLPLKHFLLALAAE